MLPAVKGIILAGGTGTRLHPITRAVCKQLLPVYDKPMIYYPISVLMLAGIRDILIITTPQDRDQFAALLGDGSQWGIELTLRGAALARRSGAGVHHRRRSLAGDDAALVLGDNLFFGHGVAERLTASGPVTSPNDRRLHVVRLPGQRSAALRRRGARQDRRAARHRGEAGRTRARTSPSPGCTSTTPTSSTIAAELEAVGARRAGDHRPQPRLRRRSDARASSTSGAAPRGWTPARTTRCSRRRSSCRCCNTGRASRSRVSKRSRCGRAIISADQAIAIGEQMGKSSYARVSAAICCGVPRRTRATP